MKKIIVLLFVTTHVLGQSVDYNKIILPDHVQSPDFAEKLVQLAWRNNPVNEMLRREIKRNDYQVKRNAGQWLDIFSVQGNLNEFTVEGTDRANFYPRYNIRAAISLGMFVTIPMTTKMDRESKAIAESNLDAQKLELRNIVM